MVASLKFGISNLIPHITMDVIITYPCLYLSQFMLVKRLRILKKVVHDPCMMTQQIGLL